MNRKLLSLLLLLLPAFAFSQKQEKIYYDVEWKGTNDTSNAHYYRLASFDGSGNPVDTVRDFYMGGEVEGKGIAIKIDRTDDRKTKWRGDLVRYYKSGLIEGRLHFNKEGKRDSLNMSYYESGKVHSEANFKNGAVVGKFRKEWSEFGYGAKVFYELFHDDNMYDWPLNTNDKHVCKIIKDSGLYMATLTGDKGVAQAIHLPLDQDKNYSVETTVDFKGGDDTVWHGIIWGFQDWNNYQFLYVSADGFVKAGWVIEGLMHNTLKSDYSKRVNKGNDKNVIEVFKGNKKMFYAINGKVVGKADVCDLRGNYAGFSLSQGKQQVVFENLIVKQNLDQREGDPDSTDAQNPNNDQGNPSGDEFKGWSGPATGFFIDPSGYIVTNYHVIKDFTEVQVDAIQDGDRIFFKAKIIASDKENDFAVLKIVDDRFKPYKSLPYNLKTETSDVASNVFALGFPQATQLGVELKFTNGTISSKSGENGKPEWYQISVPLQPGNSGSPLFDYNGNIIGVVKAQVDIPGEQNVNYAIKSSYLKSFLESLTEKFNLPHDTSIAAMSLTDKIKLLTDYVVMIKVK